MGKQLAVSSEQSAVLKPCPFCGSKAELEFIGINDPYFVKCSNENCCGETSLFEKSGEAIEAWNHRPVEQELLEVLKEFLDNYEADERLCWGSLSQDAREIIEKAEGCYSCGGAGKNREDVEYIGDCENCGLLIFSDDEWGKDDKGILLCKPCMTELAKTTQDNHLFNQRNKTR